MIVTSVMLSDMVHDSLSYPKAALLLASLTIDNSPKLVSLDWLADNQEWCASKSLSILKKHYEITDADFKFVDQNSLSVNDVNQVFLLKVINQIKEYLNGEREVFDLPLELSLGTLFQQKVWAALQKIPHGETISYAKLADNIGQPKAFRAVANANGKNPFSIIIPCHRVIASDGKLGGYTGGLDKKEYLLALEGVEIKR